MPLTDESRRLAANRIQAAMLRESLALVEAGIAQPQDVDAVVKNAIGRRLSVGGPFEVWEQIGWDLVQTIAGELFKEISNASEPSSVLVSRVEAGDLGVKSGRGFYEWADQSAPTPEARLAGINSANAEQNDQAVNRINVQMGQIENVAVIGAGLMGHGIALEFAAHGRSVVLNDVSEALLEEALRRARVGLQALAQSGRISDEDIEPAMARISASTDLRESVEDADLVIEAVSENLELKQSIFTQLERHAPRRTILASNSSTFVPSVYTLEIKDPSRVIGIHYYNPPHLLPGVEIVKGPETSNATLEKVWALYELLGKKPALIQQEIEGFIGNRLQVAILREAMSLVDAGTATAAQIDELVRSTFGQTWSVVGPFELADHEGLDTVLASARKIFPTLAIDRELPRVLMDKIDSGDLGVKTGRGFYDWTPESVEHWRKNMADALLNMASRDQ